MRLKHLKRDFDTVIFDLDGTVVDSMWMWEDIDREYLARYGHPFDPNLQADIEGMNLKETALYFQEHFQIPRSIDEMREDWIEMSIQKYREEVSLKPYAREFLTFLKSSGIRIGIATSNAMEMVNACLRSNSAEHFFDIIVSASDVERGKPFPDVFLHAAKLLGADPSRCIVFEDIPAGIRAGKAAGMEVVAVYDDFSADLSEEKKALADYYIHDYSELME